MLLDATADPKLEFHSRWELKLAITFSNAVWSEASTSSSKLSRCVNHTELMRTIHLRWYLTMVRLAHMSSTSSHSCWRQCRQVGTLLHMWWSCPLHSIYWSEVTDLIMDTI